MCNKSHIRVPFKLKQEDACNEYCVVNVQVSITLIATGFGGKNTKKSILAYKDKAQISDGKTVDANPDDDKPKGGAGGVPIPEFLKRRRPWGNRS